MKNEVLDQENESLACFAWQALLVDPSVSVALFRELCARVPDRAEHWAALGVALAKNNQRREAIKALARSLEIKPKNIEAWCAIGELYVDEMEWKQASAAFKKCLELDPQAKNPHGLRARALIKKSEKVLEKAVG